MPVKETSIWKWRGRGGGLLVSLTGPGREGWLNQKRLSHVKPQAEVCIKKFTLFSSWSPVHTWPPPHHYPLFDLSEGGISAWILGRLLELLIPLGVSHVCGIYTLINVTFFSWQSLSCSRGPSQELRKVDENFFLPCRTKVKKLLSFRCLTCSLNTLLARDKGIQGQAWNLRQTWGMCVHVCVHTEFY